jgi:peptide/nickel transport system ATP-binding protein
MKQPLLKVDNLKVHFPVRGGLFQRIQAYVRAVDGVSFSIKEGETLSLVGESGSGKTTVGRSILRAIDPTEGHINYHIDDDDIDISSLSGEELRNFRRHIQLIFQDPFSSLNPRMTVFDIIAEPLVVNNLASGDELRERVNEMAQRCKLSIEHLRRFPHAFSGGQRQRIGIARALVVNPKFIVCDESVSALDVSIQAEILNLLEDLQTEFGVAYLFIAHDLSVVAHISDRVAVMYLGQIVEIAPTIELFANPKHPYTEGLMSAIPEIDPDRKMKAMGLKGEIPSPMNPPSGCRFHTRCPYAKDICEQEQPPLVEYAPQHMAACHFVEELTLEGAHIPTDSLGALVKDDN